MRKVSILMVLLLVVMTGCMVDRGMGPEAGNPSPFSDANTVPELEMTETAQAAEVDSLRAATAEAAGQSSTAVKTIQGLGNRIQPYDTFDNQGNPTVTECSVAVVFTLTIQPDDSAELVSTGPDLFDPYNNCAVSESASEVIWYAHGVIDPATEVAQFTNCNQGGFEADGTVQYKNSQLSGTVSCRWKEPNGKTAITFVLEE